MSPRLLRPIASKFDPAKIAGLQLWLDAADSSTIDIDTGVSEWRDKSPIGSIWVQSTGNEQPATGTATINGRNVLVFDGSNDSLSASAPLSTSMPLSFFIVQRIVTGTFAGMTYTAGTGDNFNWRQAADTNGTLEILAGGGRIHLGGELLAQNTLYALTVPASGNATIHRNGADVSVSSNAALKPTLTGTHYIGRRSDGFYGNIQVAEIIAYSTELTTVQRRTVESYLGKKWGITVT
jgi:hypothetical protein